MSDPLLMGWHVPRIIRAEKFDHVSLQVPDQYFTFHVVLFVALRILLVSCFATT